MKQCRVCGGEFPPEMFPPDSRRCRKCGSRAVQEWKLRARAKARPMTEHDMLRFWAKVDKSGECWTWKGARNRQGYGRFWTGSRQRPAHAALWEYLHGPVLSKMEVCHKCDNPPCCNPDHLFLGTKSDNMQDCTAKGRHGMQVKPESVPRGEQQWHACLTEEIALAIWHRFYAGGVTKIALAREYGVGKHAVYKLLAGQSWQWLLRDLALGTAEQKDVAARILQVAMNGGV